MVGIGRTAFSRDSGRTPLAMAAEAARLALEDAGLQPSEVDGVIDFHTNDSASATDVGRAIGAVDLGLAMDIHGGGNLAVTVVGQAVAAVQAGHRRLPLAERPFGQPLRTRRPPGRAAAR